jgi:hypothetical protein
VTAATLDVDTDRPRREAPGAPPTALRFLDLFVLVLALPIVVLTGAPLIGYVCGAGGWLVARGVGQAVESYGARTGDQQQALLLAVAGLMVRLLIVATAIVAAARVGDRDDGLEATVLVLVAFTLYFFMAVALRPRPGRGAR